jgi:hypothetical protein
LLKNTSYAFKINCCYFFCTFGYKFIDMKTIVLSFALCLSSACLFAQAADHDHSKHAPGAHAHSAIESSNSAIAAIPVVETLKAEENEYDFGKIPQGKAVTHVFVVANTGKTAFKLDNVQASCGCTTPEWDKEAVIEPGMKAKITVGYNAASEGVFTKPVTITYNGTQTKVLNIKGEVWKVPSTPAPTNDAAVELKK